MPNINPCKGCRNIGTCTTKGESEYITVDCPCSVCLLKSICNRICTERYHYRFSFFNLPVVGSVFYDKDKYNKSI